MSKHLKFFIDGAWVDPVVPALLDVVDPSTEEAFTTISIGSRADVDRAVLAARQAFAGFSQTGRDERLALLERILAAYNERFEDIAQAVSREMGAPLSFARDAQAWRGARISRRRSPPSRHSSLPNSAEPRGSSRSRLVSAR